ncbi:unnamed protein product [Parnassius mnemosyne]|uniref:Lipocalin/cytosolic fatty-acid binding domain-containing protein n=1 Tax=Parnassius mnemosyne TaxID=213953 RepID=A0AAV1L4T0_9NEOP
MIGSAFVASNDGSGILNVTFVLANGVVNVANYYILETDYISYSLVYSCRNLPDGNRQVSSWKLSRTRTLSNQANNIMNNIISNTRGLLEEYYITSDQSDETCFYVPEVIPDQAPVFRGQCEDITGVQGFDIQKVCISNYKPIHENMYWFIVNIIIIYETVFGTKKANM